jgi:AcrR family transcriptional regulator
MARTLQIEKRRDLARKAMEILRREGLEMSMTALAASLGLKRPTLLYYFPDRASIVEIALEATLAEQVMFVVSEMGKVQHPVDRLYAQVCSVHRFHRGREERIIFLIQALATASKERTDRILTIGNQAFEMHRLKLARDIETAIANGTMHSCDPQALIQLVRSVVDGVLLQRVMTDCEFEPIHAFLWKHVLEPLKSEAQRTEQG